MNHPALRPDEHMIDPASEADLARQWTRLEAVLAKPPGRGRGWYLALGAVGIAAIAALGLSPRRSRLVVPVAVLPVAPLPIVKALPLLTNGARFESETASALALADGSRVLLAGGGAVTLAYSGKDEVRLVLERGRADFDVVRNTGRRFVVAVADVHFVVEGARFVLSVSDGISGKTMTAAVQGGTVEVDRPSARSLLLAGESWSGIATTTLAPRADGSSPVADDAVEDARTLFAGAARARWQGRQREAAAGLEKLCRRFPNDPRAPLAAFQLGRIQLDTLHEAARAAQSFGMAMSLARDPVRREDAAARHAEALDRAGEISKCRLARATYLAEYPEGAHAGRVTAFCRDR
jgi:TolA-binding protein